MTLPQTPDIHSKVSKRQFDGMVRKWRRMLHCFDPPPAELNDEANPLEASAPPIIPALKPEADDAVKVADDAVKVANDAAEVTDDAAEVANDAVKADDKAATDGDRGDNAHGDHKGPSDDEFEGDDLL